MSSIRDPLALLLRLFLSATFLLYGLLKLTGGQFIHGDSLHIDSATDVGSTMVWKFFGWSWPYTIFIGMGEVVAALLVLIPRTRRLGYLMYFPIALNIAVMDVCFGFPMPATLLVSTLAAVCLFLMWRERQALLPALID